MSKSNPLGPLPFHIIVTATGHFDPDLHLTNGPLQTLLLLRRRYSLGSIALWTRADGGVQLILSNAPALFRTRRHFSYFRFFVPDAVDAFKLVISDCSIVARRTPRPNADAERTCIDFVDIR